MSKDIVIVPLKKGQKVHVDNELNPLEPGGEIVVSGYDGARHAIITRFTPASVFFVYTWINPYNEHAVMYALYYEERCQETWDPHAKVYKQKRIVKL